MTRRSQRIVVNALSSRSGGGLTYINNLLGGLQPEHDVEVFVLVAPVQVETINPGHATLIECQWAGRSVVHRFLWERCVLPGVLEGLRADVYYAPGGSLTTRPPPGCGVAVAFRNLLPFSPKHRRLYRFGYTRLRLLVLRYLQARSFSRADLVIAVGSTLEVEPAASVPRSAREHGAVYVIVNQGPTAHDQLADLRIEGDATQALPEAVDRCQRSGPIKAK